MIIASVVTIPGRLNLLFESLDELLESTVMPDFLYVSISKYYPRLDLEFSKNEFVMLKSKLDEYPIPNKIITYSKDIGPSAKLYTPLKYHENLTDNDFIVIFDDDTGLFPHAIESLIRCCNVSGRRACYGFVGFGFDSNWFLHGEYITFGDFFPLRLLGGYRGCLYPVTFNIEDFLGFIDWIVCEFDRNGLVPFHDDHIFSSYFLDRKIPIRLANLVQKYSQNESDILFYEPKQTHNGIMQSSNHHENVMILYNLFLNSNVDIRAF